MKTLEAIVFDPCPCRREIATFKTLLQSRGEEKGKKGKKGRGKRDMQD
jgi:hypothetical protein